MREIEGFIWAFEKYPNLNTSELPFYEKGEELFYEQNQVVIGNKMNKTYHLPTCTYAPKNKNKRIEFKNLEIAEQEGFKPCATCRPNLND